MRAPMLLTMEQPGIPAVLSAEANLARMSVLLGKYFTGSNNQSETLDEEGLNGLLLHAIETPQIVVRS